MLPFMAKVVEKKYLNNFYITFWVQRWHLVLLHTVYSHA